MKISQKVRISIIQEKVHLQLFEFHHLPNPDNYKNIKFKIIEDLNLESSF